MNFKRFSLIAASLFAIGCGVNNPSISTLSDQSNSLRSFADGNGHRRTFSFNLERAKAQEAARPFTVRTTRAALPAMVDLRSTCSPVGDQGDIGSCTAWSMARGLREFMMNKNHDTYTQLSPLYFYYKERVIENTINEDSGATMTDGMTVLTDTGCAPEKDWPYITSKFTVKPSAQADTNAPQFKIKKAIPINGQTPDATLIQIKEQIAKGNAVVFGFEVFKSFMGQGVARTGIMPMPKPGEQSVGGHAVMVVGYDDAKKMLIMRNSWGTGWGDKGYFYMPYANMSHCEDIWTAE
ncbi:MAG: C1 family peptidase [Bacteroidota bacterium]